METEGDARRGEGLALASIIFASLACFPAAVLLGGAALARLHRKSGYRSVARWAVLLGGIEGVVTVVVIAFVLLHDPFPGRMRAALDQMRKIAVAQEEYKAQARTDLDGDGVGEFGHLHELASGPDPLVSHVFAMPTDKGYVEKYGYYFMIFLPGRDWNDASNGRDDPLGMAGGGADAREKAWIAYAWPAVRGKTAVGLFVAHPGGIYRAKNDRARFDGEARMPRPCSAMTGTGLDAGVPEEGAASVDGETWVKLTGPVTPPSK